MCRTTSQIRPSRSIGLPGLSRCGSNSSRIRVRTKILDSAGVRSSFTLTSRVAGAGRPEQEFSSSPADKLAALPKIISWKTRPATGLLSSRDWIPRKACVSAPAQRTERGLRAENSSRLRPAWKRISISNPPSWRVPHGRRR